MVDNNIQENCNTRKCNTIVSVIYGFPAVTTFRCKTPQYDKITLCHQKTIFDAKIVKKKTKGATDKVNYRNSLAV